jgi:plastocyanin
MTPEGLGPEELTQMYGTRAIHSAPTPVSLSSVTLSRASPSERKTEMRKLFVAGITTLALVGALVGLVGTASATSPAKAKPPVKLDGKVNNKGTKTVKGGTIEVEQDNYYFGPTFIKAKGGATVKVELKNEGSADHTFTIDDQSIDKTVSPGDTTTVDVAIPADGKPVNFYCRFHVASGMQGAFFTKSGGKAKSTSSSDGGGYGY